MAAETILVIGGSGFVGRHVVNRLVADGHTVVVPTRRPVNANPLKLLPTVDIVECDVNRPGVLARLVERASAVINLVGILNESRAATFAQAHVELPRSIVAACVAARVRRLVHMSALNADPAGPSRYLRSKGEGEAVVAASGSRLDDLRAVGDLRSRGPLPQSVRQAAAIRAGDAARGRRRPLPAGLRRRRRRMHGARASARRDVRAEVPALRPADLHAARSRSLRRAASPARAAPSSPSVRSSRGSRRACSSTCPDR